MPSRPAARQAASARYGFTAESGQRSSMRVLSSPRELGIRISALHRYGVDDARLEIETKKLEMAARKLGELDEEESEDDGFLDALNGSAADDWAGDESLEVKAENEEETSDI